MSRRPTNPNIVWSQIFVDELARNGLRHVCIAPGSRSTPLTLAFASHSAITVHLHLDERSAAFFALGIALAQDSPVALVCTSGTAAGNFHPAIIEARQSHVALLVLTADRPPELRQSGANQTIDQIKMYGDHVLWSVDAALPERDAPAVAYRNLRTLAARTFARADGIEKGPVHINFPFRKPLEPARDEIDRWQGPNGPEAVHGASMERPFTRISRGTMEPTESQIDALKEVIEANEKGLIVCGPRCPRGGFPAAVTLLSRNSGYPILADALSGVRFGPHVTGAPIVGGYETFLGRKSLLADPPDVIIRFGDVLTSKSLNSYLDEADAIHRLHISHNGVWADDSHRVSEFWHVDPTSICRQVAHDLPTRSSTGWSQRLLAIEAACWQAMDDALQGAYFDGAAVTDLMDLLPPDVLFFAGNSLPVRHLDQFARPHVRQLRTFANRGASGIDGNISTALGIGAVGDGHLVALIGDITFYHDMNGLLAVKNLATNVTIVLLNNQGGGIFRRLPIADIDPPFTKLFLTPHGLDFEPAVRTYGLDYVRVDDRRAFSEALIGNFEDRLSRVIEVSTDSQHDFVRRLEVMGHVNDAIARKMTA